jgi:uncharacterized membrane protein
MPYEWLPPSGDTQRLHLWPYRSLTRRGFVIFIAITATLITLPLLATIGSPVLWGLLPFLMLAVAGVWYALHRNYKDAEIVEDLRLATDQISVTRHGPRGKLQTWKANPYWVRVTLHATGGPVPNYLTLKGDGREVELGAFLSEDERIRLHDDLQRALEEVRRQ